MSGGRSARGPELIAPRAKLSSRAIAWPRLPRRTPTPSSRRWPSIWGWTGHTCCPRVVSNGGPSPDQRAPQERATRDAGLAGVSSLDPPWISTPRLGQPDHPHPSPHGAPRPDHRQPRRGPRSQPKGCTPPAWIAISSCQLHPGGPSGSTSRLPFGEKATPAVGVPNARVARWRHLGPVTLTIRSAMTNAVTLSSSTVRSGV